MCRQRRIATCEHEFRTGTRHAKPCEEVWHAENSERWMAPPSSVHRISKNSDAICFSEKNSDRTGTRHAKPCEEVWHADNSERWMAPPSSVYRISNQYTYLQLNFFNLTQTLIADRFFVDFTIFSSICTGSSLYYVSIFLAFLDPTYPPYQHTVFPRIVSAETIFFLNS